MQHIKVTSSVLAEVRIVALTRVVLVRLVCDTNSSQLPLHVVVQVAVTTCSSNVEVSTKLSAVTAWLGPYHVLVGHTGGNATFLRVSFCAGVIETSRAGISF